MSGLNYEDWRELRNWREQKEKEKMATYTSTCYPACPHHTGWYFKVKFLFFEKRLFWCDLCHSAIPREWVGKLEK